MSLKEGEQQACQALLQRAQRDPAFRAWRKAVWEQVTKSGKHTNLVGPGLSQKAYLLAATFVPSVSEQSTDSAADAHQVKVPEQIPPTESFVLLVPDELQLRIWSEHLRPYFPDLLSFRPREYDLHGAEASSRKQEHQRLSVLAALLQPMDKPIHLIVSAPALLQRLPNPKTFAKSCLSLSPEHAPTPEQLEAHLLASGYEKRTTAEAPGQFARRGDILDLVPVSWGEEGSFGSLGEGLRLTYFDDELDAFTHYSLESQRSLGPWSSPVLVPPAREVLIPVEENERKALADDLLETGGAALRQWKAQGVSGEAIRKLEGILQTDASNLREGLVQAPVDRYLDWIWKDEHCILDYCLTYAPAPALPGAAPIAQRKRPLIQRGIIFIDEPSRLSHSLDASQAEWARRVQDGMEKGVLLSRTQKNQLTRVELMRRLDQNFSLNSLSTIGVSGNGLPGAQLHKIRGRESESYRGREQELLARFRDPTSPCARLCVLAENRREKLVHLLREEAIPSERAQILPLGCPHGFEYPAADLWLLGIEEVFSSGAKKRRSKRKKALSLDLFSDLRPGDLVVHDVHGIGRYEGLENVEHNGVRRDYLRLRYAQEDTLFLPMEALDQIQKYIGASEANPPKLSRLGGNDWNKLKERARESVKHLATNLVQLYAQRRRLKGHAFAPTSPWEREFAEQFPYEETSDQLQSIQEICADMESEQVMDRLLCGDVGFGKTEVAFRAIFKSVMGGKQAAFLAPTTVLAQQHYENFVRRVGDFPVRIGLLSRFALEALQKRTLRGLRTGEIDVVIGTHRLLSQDVKFKQLGLLVVDEEQRFGVDHKETLKERYPEVDVLSLSATPIPRTLHMSLSGIRSISVLEDPPLDRRAVLTYVMEYEDEVIQEAILRELSRGGQVFYLFNNTHKMAARVQALQELLPGARILWAHGKLSEVQLENVITSFLAGEADILVCTTIIESGIDMPNVNTLIVEQADRLGLAQLYQLRGRVGRSGRQGYAYITYHRDKILTETAEQRLAAIRDYTELGAGFKIAMRDLEVRGAGNLLGGEQHGQMAAIGYDLYCRMLDEEIQTARLAVEEQEESNLAGEPAGLETSDGIRLVGEQNSQTFARAQANAAEQAKQRGANLLAAAKLAEALPPVETVVDLPVSAYLSRDFVPDEGQRMDLYRRLTGIDSELLRQDVIDELLDRFGDLPREVLSLAEISYIRHRAGQLGITSVALVQEGRAGNPRVVFKLVTGRPLPMKRIGGLMDAQSYSGQMVFQADEKPQLVYIPRTQQINELITELGDLFRHEEKLR